MRPALLNEKPDRLVISSKIHDTPESPQCRLLADSIEYGSKPWFAAASTVPFFLHQVNSANSVR